jgi:chromate transporter
MEPPAATHSTEQGVRRPVSGIFWIFLKLGLTSFGGPIAHLGYFREAFVVRRRWLDDEAYAALVALCQILPGPASSQVGFAIGLRAAGVAGALAAFLGFTLPSAALMLTAAFGLVLLPETIRAPLFHGLILVAVPIVAQAVIGMAMKLCSSSLLTAAIGAAALCVLLAFQQPWLQPVTILAGGVAGMALIKAPARTHAALVADVTPGRAIASMTAFAALLIGLPLLAAATGSAALAFVDGVYRSGALVFGGGHVILPLLEAETVGRGLVDADTFLAGYGAAQALPGPLSAFAGFLGAAASTGLPPLLAGIVALGAVFAPGFLLLLGVLPFWTALAARRWMAGLAAGAGAAVVGVLAAALWRPVITSAILSPADALIAAAGLAALLGRAPVWLVVLAVALAGAYSSAG